MSDMINEEEKIGKISIADGVVASIAGIAAIEVEGVSKLTGNISKELVAKLGKILLTKLCNKLLRDISSQLGNTCYLDGCNPGDRCRPRRLLY